MEGARTPLIDNLLEALLDQTSDHAVLLFDASERIVWVSTGATRIFGREAAELVGCESRQLFVEEDVRMGIPAHEFAVARSHGSAEDDRWTLRPDGSRFWATGVAYSLWDKQMNLIGYGKVIQNRTDWKEQQEALKNQVSGLARLDEQKNRMISILAHELRNPLVPLANAAELLKNGAPVAYPVKLIERQVDFIKRLVDDLLDSIRVHAGKVQLQVEPLVLQEVLADAVETVAAEVRQREQSLELLAPSGPIALMGDPTRLQQVFCNLLTNASRYTPKSGRIWIKATAEGSEAVVRVVDNGRGIEPEMLGHIFDLFAQVHASESTDGGLGIGLSLVKELVGLHEGTVQANSDGLGKGSDFIVRLPATRSRPVGPGTLEPDIEARGN